METLSELINELTSNDRMMWVIGGGEVASENTSKGIKEPDFSNGWYTIEADNWHFHLAEASVNGKVDTLEGLKENVIVGRLIPAGTGGMLNDLQRVAAHRDELILEERARIAAERMAEQGGDAPALIEEGAAESEAPAE